MGLVLCGSWAGWRYQAQILDLPGEFLVKSDRLERCDAVLVLGGDFLGPRVLKGAELGATGYAPKVLISGPPYADRRESDDAIEFLVKRGYPRALFTGLPNEAKSTIEEAIALAPQLERLGVHNAILVTRASHSRRASIVFWLFCPKVRFRSVPAVEEVFKTHQWWTDPVSKERVTQEWSKILGTVLWRYPLFLVGR